jgi:hypothetical protein
MGLALIVVDRSVDPTPQSRRIAEQSTTLQIAQFCQVISPALNAW